MAALTLPEALKRTRSLLMKGMIKEIVTEDEMANVIPIVPTNGTSVDYIREGTLPSTEFIGDSGASTEESSGTDDRVIVPMRRIVGNVDVDAFADDLTGDSPGEQRGVQVAKKGKATWNMIKSTMITGGHVTGFSLSDDFPHATTPGPLVDTLVSSSPYIDSARFGPGSIKYTATGTLLQFRAPGDITYGTAVDVSGGDGSYTLTSHNPSKWIRVTIDASDVDADSVREIMFTSSTNQFDGMNKMVTSTQLLTTVGAAGDAFSFAMMDKLISKVKVGGNRAFVLNSTLVEKYYAAHRALGGTQPPTVMLPNYGAPVPTYRGFPLLKNDNIPSAEAKGGASTLSSMYFASFDADQGLSLCAAGGGSFDAMGDPRNRIVLGFRVVDLGERDESDHRRIRVKWYGAMKLKSTLALARQPEIITAG